jgi:putative restriction endonuclease
VGVTDNSWYRFLAARPGMTEVNFWQPSGGREFRVLAPGEPFFFKTHYPSNRLVDGGLFSDSARLRVSEAWELFSEANGVASVEQMRGAYRPLPAFPDQRGRRPGYRLSVRPRRPLLPGQRNC